MTKPQTLPEGFKFVGIELWKYWLVHYHGMLLIKHAKRLKRSAARYTHHRNKVLTLIVENADA